ncbi:glycosyltransferase [Neobacillus sp. PS3-34]|uniref:glycosyltransferase family 2 protein n=1 Tax=Neobacillus sp. PS3-34 TaxID=3070678 RepID=UPI0027E1909C|nr:glycosyltransferase [Neobacillus sp. PS3-34]WML47810.1 glycosyltransferase [Neobacillus sp. PS3-34]
MKPIISIIVPVYNVEQFIEECIDSILEQNFPNFEVLLVNDGSTDKSGEICEQYALVDTRVKVIHKDYEGVSSARNTGIIMAQGDYIGFVDGDDRIEKNMYEELYKLCIESRSDISICKLGREINGVLINNTKEELILEMNNLEAMSQLFKGELFRFSLCNKLFKRTCFENVVFPVGRIHEDLSTTYKLFANSTKTIFKNFIGYIYVKRENSILTAAFNEKRLDAFTGWNEILLFMNKKYLQLYNEILACFVFWCVDNIFYILHQVNSKTDRNIYLEKIRKMVRRNYKDIIKNGELSLNYKYIITLFYFNFRLLIVSNNIKNFIGNKK